MTYSWTCTKSLSVSITMLGFMDTNGRIGLCDSLLFSRYYLKLYSHAELFFLCSACYKIHFSSIPNLFRLLGLTPYTILDVNFLWFLYISHGRISLSVSESPIILPAGNLHICLFFTYSCRILISQCLPYNLEAEVGNISWGTM